VKISIKTNLPRVFAAGGNVDITPALLRVGYAVRDRTNVYPPKTRSAKIRWASERQRRYVLSHVPLPYIRRGYLAKMWMVTPTPPAQVVVRNTAPYAAFVIGRAQQPFHLDRGWKRVDEETGKVARDKAVIKDVAAILEQQLKQR